MAGVAPLSPGYDRFRVRPSRLDVTATVPISQGRRIQVDFKPNTLEMEVPIGTQAQLAVPRDAAHPESTVSFSVKTEAGSEAHVGHACLHSNRPFWCFEKEFPQGTYLIQLQATALPAAKASPFPEPSWAVTLDNVDHQVHPCS